MYKYAPITAGLGAGPASRGSRCNKAFFVNSAIICAADDL